MPPSSNSNLTSTVVTTAKGDVTVVKNFVHEFGVTHPITLAVVSLIVGNVVGVFLHL